jgi:deoxycytidine triphosphate deaminase
MDAQPSASYIGATAQLWSAQTQEEQRMELQPGKQAAPRVQGMMQAKYQVHGYSVSLTVKNVYSIDPTGQVDFGGGEYVSAGRVLIEPVQRRPEERYPWWNLGRGSYFIEFNETLELGLDEVGILEPDERLVRAGASHPSVFLRGRISPVETLLEVSALRLELKQNARISRLRLFKMGEPACSDEEKPLSKPRKKSKLS